MPILEVVRSSLLGWRVYLRMVVPCNGQYLGLKNLLPRSILCDLLQSLKFFWSIVLLQIIKKLNRIYTYLDSQNIKELPCRVGAEDENLKWIHTTSCLVGGRTRGPLGSNERVNYNACHTPLKCRHLVRESTWDQLCIRGVYVNLSTVKVKR